MWECSDNKRAALALTLTFQDIFEATFGRLKAGDSIVIRLSPLGGSVSIQTALMAAAGKPPLELKLPIAPSLAIH